MPERISILGRMLISPDFGYLTKKERNAVLRAVMVTFVTRSGVAMEDRLKFRRALVQLPWAWEPSADTSDGLVDRSQVGLEKIRTPSGLTALAADLARGVSRPARRRSLFRLMTALALCDGATARDLVWLRSVQASLGIEEAEARALTEKVHEEVRASAVTSVTASLDLLLN